MPPASTLGSCPTVDRLAGFTLLLLPFLAASYTSSPACLRQVQIKTEGLQGLVHQGRLPAGGGGTKLGWG